MVLLEVERRPERELERLGRFGESWRLGRLVAPGEPESAEGVGVEAAGRERSPLGQAGGPPVPMEERGRRP